jgi:hypothetical protein
MTINWVISEGRLSLVCDSRDGGRSLLLDFEEVVTHEEAHEVIQVHREEILEVCTQNGIDPSEIQGL